ncbi:twin-arginine translocation pathway signal protein [Mesorhizobium sp. SARCC-RB16n]|uniref:xanthine dehydrogenase family protein molybdopterin-binding subunit n=1 Tax=Mesorhizobium sp. SARCC-RB16n TaxID=2116687 RepID=UPI00122F0B24|nr:molybdopterin cofactor-binding domain-containing protein [Mesorhizobium sp. SARCC-RB16n]KAA3451602.1 twin-arginine translocation pathway signal protein [Mesorhizobium sp. SARCC-RB16n]
MTHIINLSRRDLLKAGAGVSALVLGMHAGLREFPVAQAAEGASFEPNVYLGIDETGLVTIVAHRSEMGTGIRTGLPMVLADELEADWSRVKVLQANGDPKYGDQNTDGSRSMRQFYQTMRVAGATARQMLEDAAALTWHVDPNECHARNHAVVHTPTGRQLPFGDLVKLAAGLPVPSDDHISLHFKSPQARRYVGKPVPIVDLHDIVRGQAKYGIDTVLPGMKYASIERCPVYGGKVRSFDSKAALAVPGVEQVVEVPATPAPSGFNPLGGIAVIANSTWAAQQGRLQLKIDWDFGANAGYDTTSYRKELEATAQKAGRVVRAEGDVDGALQSAAKRVSADYFVPHYSHAPMEVPAAAARVENSKCEVWAPSQNPQGARTTVADVLSLKESDVTIHTTLLGGAFGRKSKHDFIAEAAWLAQKIGAPVKVTWTREDDIQHDYFHAICAQHIEAGLDGNGAATAWLHRTVFPPIEATFQPSVTYGTAGELQQGFMDVPYAIANVRCENGPAQNHVRIGWYRSVFNVPHAFAVCSFADELAAAAGRDPVEYLRELIGPARIIDLRAIGVDYPNYGAPLDQYPIDTARLHGVLDLAVANSGWGEALPQRHGRGVAVHRSFLTYVAVVAHVAIGNDGQIAIPRIDMAVDCGLVVNPDRVRSQFEGAAIMAISNALYSNITAKDGRIEQSNFTDYDVARTDITPETHVHIVESSAPPAGVGEPGVPPTAPAICNAIFAATGKRIRALPIDPSELKST